MTPTSLRPRLLAVLLAAGLALPAGADAAAGPAVSTAPGRVVFAVDGAVVQSNVDAGGAYHAVALPDGGTMLFGTGAAGRGVLYAAKVGPRGALDASFGTGGTTLFATPLNLLQVLRQPDGKLLLVGAKLLVPGQFEPGLLQVMRLNADATLDRSYGAGGTATTAIGEGCGSCTSAALTSDGALVLTGTNGPPQPNLKWALTRLTSAGAVDQGFGAGGIATIPTAGSTSGFNIALGPGGTIVTEAQMTIGSRSVLLLTRRTASGAPDPTFAGGTPVAVPFASGFLMLVHDDGSIVLGGQPAGSILTITTPSRQMLARYTAAGAPDPAFGTGGFVDLGSASTLSQILPTAGRSVLAVGELAAATPSGRLNVRLVSASGAIDPALGGPQRRNLDLPFGGGGSSFLVSVKPRPVATLFQNGFAGNRLVRRVDGSYLVAGGVAVSRPTGEGTGFSIGRFAAAAFTPALTPDTSFGGPPTPLGLSVRLSRQRARTAFNLHGIRVVLRSSAVGLADVKITHGGRAIAHSLLAVFKTAGHTLPVELTRYGNAYLRRHRNVRVAIRVNGRDLLTNTATATARGRLR